MCAHLAAHAHRLERRLEDYRTIVSSLLFPSRDSKGNKTLSTIYDTSHLFFLGDLNFRVVLPDDHPLSNPSMESNFASLLESEATRRELRDYDQLSIEQKKGTVLQSLREGKFHRFKCSYKFEVGQVDRYK